MLTAAIKTHNVAASKPASGNTNLDGRRNCSAECCAARSRSTAKSIGGMRNTQHAAASRTISFRRAGNNEVPARNNPIAHQKGIRRPAIIAVKTATIARRPVRVRSVPLRRGI